MDYAPTHSPVNTPGENIFLDVLRKRILRLSPMNPKSIINDLCAAGLTQTSIASGVGLHQSGVSRLKTGKQAFISYAVGERLIALHRKHKQRRAAKRKAKWPSV